MTYYRRDVMTEAPTTVEEVVRHRLATTVGGLRGSIEAAVPTVAFVLVWTVTKQLRPALVLAAAAVLVGLVVRLAQRQTPRFALSSLLGLALAAWFALRTGRAQDAFLPGILYSCAMLGVSLLSVVARWPLVGFIVGATDLDDPLSWHKHRGTVRLCQRLTLVMSALFGIRAAIMLPLYLTGQVTLLGVAKIALGWPLYLAAMAAVGAILLKGRTPLDL
jgi:hypothetical protein